MNERTTELGILTRGSLIEGVEMRLIGYRSVEDVKAGKFVVIEGEKNDFFSMITDIRLDTTSPQILVHPPNRDDVLMREVLAGSSAYATVMLRPMLMVAKGDQPSEVLPARGASVCQFALRCMPGGVPSKDRPAAFVARFAE